MTGKSEPPATGELADIQSHQDDRKIEIDRVGVRKVRHPIVVRDRAQGTQATIGEFTLTVLLPHHFKGTHMSRFMEVLSEVHGDVSPDGIRHMLDRLRERLSADEAHVEVRFPYFMAKSAPVTGREGMMEYEAGFAGASNGELEFEIYARVAVTTLCPCSKEISERGAHNQRGYVTVRVTPREHIWLEEIIEAIERSASCDLFPVLKRPDEKLVTERAYDRPRFVEDVVREVARAFDVDDRIAAYEVEVENHESIHAHNAYACLKRNKRGS